MNKISLILRSNCKSPARIFRLLHAEASRRCMSILFTGELLYLLVRTFLQTVCSSYGFDTTVSYFLFDNMPAICIFAAADSSIQISQELGGRTIDNKLLVGFSKADFFLAEVMCSVLQGVLLLTADTIFTAALCAASGCAADIAAFAFCANMFIALAGVSAVSAFSAMLACLICHRLLSLCVAVGIALLLLHSGQATVSALTQPAFTDTFNSEHTMQENPLYVSGVQRTVLCVRLAISPYAQAVYANYMVGGTPADKAENSWLLTSLPYHVDFIIIDLAECLLLYPCGAYIFERKDLR